MKRILVVDDSTTILKFVEDILKEKYNPVLVKSGELALAYLAENQVDMVLLDIFMPKMDGFETFKRIKEMEPKRDIPVVFFTSGVEAENEIKALAMGAKDFIRKPFVPQVMMNRINNILELDELTKNLERKVEQKTRQVEQLSFEIIATIASMIEAKDKYTKGHSIRVAEYSAMLAEALGWDEEKVKNLKYIALLHDIGKVGIPDRVLNKPGKLTDNEFNIIKSHTTIGGDILKDIETITYVDAGAKYHHERYEGGGYPSGIAGANIPTVARIISIADAYDAMNSKRVYRDVLPKEIIRRELINGRGTQFDPDFLDKFIKLFDEDKLYIAPEVEEEKEKTITGEGSQLIQQIMKSIEEEARKAGDTDYLTGLLSRMKGEERISCAMTEANGCFAFIDLDNLKRTNDTMGHLAGDYALMTVGEVLSAHSQNAIAMRLGGDEFVLYMIGADKEDAIRRMNDIYEDFAAKRERSPYLSGSSLSAGLCMCTPKDAYTDILAKADKALYHVKQRGKGSYYFYTSSMNQAKKNSSDDLNRLVTGLTKEGGYSGSLSVEYREFAKVYDFVRYIADRFSHNLELIMITVQPEVAGSLYIDEKEAAMLCMEKTIQASLRTVDVCTRFSSEQFLVVLMDAEKEDIDFIVNRIFDNFSKIYKGKPLSLDYDIAEIAK
ncbi:MAG: diguanylate cyclase [Lachnospiraceae bacterium]|nr:diguanylate cyclase [Lachnospiraceae bacterium]